MSLFIIDKKHRGNLWILLLTLGISLFGVVMVFSASYYTSISEYGNPYEELKSAALWFVIGWGIFILASAFNYKIFNKKSVSYIILGIGFCLLILLFTPLGKTINNATRWIQIGPVTIMPGEIIKTCFILFFSRFLAESKERSERFKYIAFGGGIAAVAAFLIYKQPNLSTAIIVVALVVGIYFMAGLPWKYILMILGVGALCLAGIVFIKGGYMLERITNFLNPFDDALGSGYQVCQALLALGSGKFWGVGLGNSIQKAIYLPECYSDFILAIIGEELGFAGISVLMIAYLGLIYCIFKVAINAKDKFCMLFCSGVGIHFALQVILNVAVVTATAPPTGVVLPLVSLGGNALLLFMGELGIVYNISKKQVVEEIET